MIPPDASAAFVANMEDVLEVYQRPHDPQRPLVCLDETSKQLIVETRAPIPAKQGRKARHDYEYERNGVANLFMVFAPLEGWRHVKVTDRHTAIDYAHTLRDLSDVHFSDAAKIVLVQDNLNTHKPASLYEAFPAAETVMDVTSVTRRSCILLLYSSGHFLRWLVLVVNRRRKKAGPDEPPSNSALENSYFQRSVSFSPPTAFSILPAALSALPSFSSFVTVSSCTRD